MRCLPARLIEPRACVAVSHLASHSISDCRAEGTHGTCLFRDCRRFPDYIVAVRNPKLGAHAGSSEPDPVYALFPTGVAIHCAPGDAEITEAIPREEESAVCHAVATRRHEFALGRQCARRALAKLGIGTGPIPVLPNRAPAWPAGTIGSITHCRGFVGAAVARRGALLSVGFDAELAQPVKPELHDLILTDSERSWISSAPIYEMPNWDVLIFCAKEAIHKCLNPHTGQWLDFQDVTVTINPATREYSAGFSTELSDGAGSAELGRIWGRFAATSEYVFASAILPAPSRRGCAWRNSDGAPLPFPPFSEARLPRGCRNVQRSRPG